MMNRLLYKVIFNKNTGLMVAVSETAHNDGKASGTDDAVAKTLSGSLNTARVGNTVIASEQSKRGNLLITKNAQNIISGSLKPIVIAFSLSLFSPTALAQTQIFADKNAPKNNQAQVLKTASGKAQVNITTPSAKGVSMNQYRQFDVGSKDAVILNNARKSTNTQTAGYINGNPNLANGEARVIVNQVNSQKPSQLNGYIEVGGKKAEVVIANPSGITVDGGGFINASKAQLVSGKTKFKDGEVKGFEIGKNQVEIKGKGLDASDTEYTQIISAANKINGKIYGNKKTEIQINAVSGSVNKNGKGKDTQTVSVDISELGGMYAGKITMVGNEKGFGVNNAGNLIATDNIHIDASGKVNNTGLMTANSTKIKSKKLDNTSRIESHQHTQISGSLNNTGSIASNGDININASKDEVHNTGSILAVGNLDVMGKDLTNQGVMGSNETINTNLTGSLNNNGEINANQLAIISRRLNNGKTGKVYANTSIQVDSDEINNTGEIISNGITQIKAKGNLNNTGSIEASEMIYGEVSGSVHNTGIINSGDITYIKAIQNIDNTGKIYGGLTALGAQKIVNRKDGDKIGIIAAREHLALGAKEIYNTGNGAGQFTDGQLILGNDTSSIISLGTASIGRTLHNDGSITGQADYLENNGALIEIAKDTEWNVKKTLNKNHRLEIERAVNQQDSKEVVRYSPYDSGQWFIEGIDGSWEQTAEHAKGQFNFYDGRSPIKQDKWTEETFTETTYRDELRHSEPAKISIGGNLKVNGEQFTVDNSKVLIGGEFISNNKDKILDIRNQESVLKEFKRQNGDGNGDDGKVTTNYKKKSDLSFSWQRKTIEEYDIKRDTPKTIIQTPSNDIVGFDENAPITNKPNVINGVSGISIALPNGNGLFKLNSSPDNPNQALIETDPKFTNYKNWLAGNYMLDRLQPENQMKRIGDGYYEQRLINEQIANLTGYRYLGGYASDEEQFKALMDNGIAIADDLQLTVGIKLTHDQVNRLTQDIVWYEQQTVTLPDGSSQEVLVPQVYLAKSHSVIASGANALRGNLLTTENSLSGNLKNTSDDITPAQQNYRYATSSVISAHTMDLTDIDELNNTGTIQAREYINIDGKKINNSGSLKSDIVKANADEMSITGGNITANRAVILTGNQVNLESTTSSNKDGTTALNQIAQIKLTGKNADGLILINAQDKITTNAVNIENNAQNGQTVLTAKDIDLGTITLVHKEKFGEVTDKNHRIVETTQEVGSNIQGAGDIKIIANDTLTGTAVNINSQNGTVLLYGENSVDIKEGRQTLDLDEAIKHKESGIVSSKTTSDHIVRHDDEALHSNITGNQVAIQSKGDIDLTGTNAVSDNGTLVYSENGNININAAENRYYSESEHQVKKSGLLGTGGIGITIGTQKTQTNADNTAIIHSGSQIGSLKGDTTIYAGEQYTQTGSTVLSAGGETTISGSQVDIKAAQNKNEDKYRQRFEQKGITVSVSSTLTDFAQTAVNVAQSAEKIGQSKNNRVNAMAAANTAYGAYRMVADDPKKGTSQLDDALASGKATAQNLANGNLTNAAVNAGVKLAISYGQQKSQSESNTKSTTAQASEVLGESVNITARENDINIIGSDVSGSLNTDLTAANNINIKSFKETESNRSNNQASGLNAGVTLALGAQTPLNFNIGANTAKGKANADSTTHRNSHIGSQTGQTNISTGETLNIKGGQVQGQGIQITAKDLNIESQQDTETYHSRQRNASGSVTFTGFIPTSGNLNAGQSKINADYASVNEQSGIFAGDDGYQINIQNHTDLTGGIITSTQTAEDNGKNQFTTGSLNATDIQNHVLYKGESFAVGIGANYNGEEVKVGSNGIGYGHDSDSYHSITKSGINTANIIITNKEQQQALTGKSVEETIANIKTDISTDNYAQYSGSLNNNFDADRVQSEIDLQREVTQEFSRNVQDLNRRQNEKLTELKAQYDNGDISLKEYNEQAKEVERNKTIINMVASGLLAPTDSVLGITTSTTAPLASQRIGIYFKDLAEKNSDGKLTTNQELAHIAAHMLLGATTAQTNDGNALAGALSAGGAEGVAAYLSQTLFDKENPADLDEDERESISAVSKILGATISTAVGDNSLDAYVGANVASNAVDENAIKAATSAVKILYKSAKQVAKKGKITAKDFGEILKKEGLDIADNVITLFDGQLTWDDAKAIIDLAVGTEFNKANKGEALKKIEQIVQKGRKGSPLPVPHRTAVKMKSGETLHYQSNPKHTAGQSGNRHNATPEPDNVLDLFSHSIHVRDDLRVFQDPKTKIIHQ
ncbi:MAG: hemagglutinin repeat-containing protein, partial [Neisseriaceae bacterium]|nr:hemagglutinin repeat-containing protein [Neisseriaceae bacterium]